MSIRRVYVIWSHPLFHEAVRLLLRHPGVQIIGVNPDYAIAQEEIVKLRPDILLVEDVKSNETTRIMKVFEACPWTMLVLLISMEDNQLNIYQHEKRTVVNTDDLLKWVLQS
jgi:AmiR/NasT family two-component response regulator